MMTDGPGRVEREGGPHERSSLDTVAYPRAGRKTGFPASVRASRAAWTGAGPATGKTRH